MQFFSTYVHPDAPDAVAAQVKSGWFSEGVRVKEFENLLQSDFGLRNPVCVNSGTAALTVALCSISEWDNSECILPAQTMVATALAAQNAGFKLVFADIDPLTGLIDVEDVRQKITDKTKVILPVLWGGMPYDMNELANVVLHTLAADSQDIFIVADAAQALGATYRGKPVGSNEYTDLCCFSFQATKHLPMNDGGCITSSPMRAEFLRKLRWFGIDRVADLPDELGERQYELTEYARGSGKYHLDDVSASLGIANANGFFKRLDWRHRLAAEYSIELAYTKGITHTTKPYDRESAYWLYPILLDGPESRLNLVRKLRSHGIPSSVVHQRIDKHPLFGGLQDLPGMAEFDRRQLHLPLNDDMTIDDVWQVCDVIKGGW